MLTEYDPASNQYKAIIDQHVIQTCTDRQHSYLMGEIVDKLATYEHGDFAQVIYCEHCAHHDEESCPTNRVWCTMLRRFMEPDGYCSYGKEKEKTVWLVERNS